MPNWKAPGPDCVQGFWLKNLKLFKVLEGTCKNAYKMETCQRG